MGEPKPRASLFARPVIILASTPLAYERALADDRCWFEEHPDENVRVRPPRAGEFYPCEGLENDVALVRVERQADGSRHRQPFLMKENR